MRTLRRGRFRGPSVIGMLRFVAGDDRFHKTGQHAPVGWMDGSGARRMRADQGIIGRKIAPGNNQKISVYAVFIRIGMNDVGQRDRKIARAKLVFLAADHGAHAAA